MGYWLHEYLEDFKGQEDSLRYVLCANAPESKDADFTWSEFQAKNNNELVAIYGNFINRVLVLTNKYWDGLVPKQNSLTKYDKEIIQKLNTYPKKIEKSIKNFKFREALAKVINLARLGNKYLADTEPWKLYKIDKKRTETIMNIAIQITASLAILSDPFMPFSSEKLKKILDLKTNKWDDASKLTISPNHQINKPNHLFKKIEDNTIELQLDKLKH